MTATTLLLVEDDPNSVFFFEHAAKQVGLTNPLHVAKDGREALNYLEGVGEFADRGKYPLPVLVLLDLRLPRATGFEVLQQVRANPNRELRKLIVVMLTSSASEEDIASAYGLGVNGYLVKPLRLEELTKMVQAIKDFWLTQNHPPPADDAEG